MTQEWLPEGFETSDLDAPARMARRVRQRVAVHRGRVRLVQGGAALAALAMLLGVAPLLWRSSGQPVQAPLQTARVEPPPAWAPERDGANESTSQRAQRDGANEPTSQRANEGGDTSSPIRNSQFAIRNSSSSIRNSQFAIRNSSPEVTLAKSGNGVDLAWTGNPGEEYVVYRCTSPKFEQCSIAGVVQGTQWKDTGSDLAPVVFYRVEPKT